MVYSANAIRICWIYGINHFMNTLTHSRNTAATQILIFFIITNLHNKLCAANIMTRQIDFTSPPNFGLDFCNSWVHQSLFHAVFVYCFGTCPSFYSLLPSFYQWIPLKRGQWCQWSLQIWPYWITWEPNLDFNTLRPRQDCRHFANDIFKWMFLNENAWISLN